MFGRLFRRRSESDTIAASLYGASVAQARHPTLYTIFGVADTVDGRFEILVIDRLRAGGEAEQAVGQDVFDLHCADMDRSLRELGVGDLGVPKRMKQMSERFYGRAEAYRAALAARDADALRAAIERNVFAGAAAGAGPLAAYVLAAHDALAAVPPAGLLTEPPRFADPAAFVSAGVRA